MVKKFYALGNSLTQDTLRYVSSLAQENGDIYKCVELYIGGLEIDGFIKRLYNAERDFDLIINGIGTRFKTSIAESAATEPWDTIVLQQAYATYEKTDTLAGYYKTLGDFFRFVAPSARILVLNTWAFYEDKMPSPFTDGRELTKINTEMAAYAADKLGVPESNIIPAGRIVRAAYEAGVPDIYRDNLHMSLSTGRYLVGQTFYSFVTGTKATTTTWRGFLSPSSEEDLLFGSVHGTHFPVFREEHIRLCQQIIDETLGL